MMTTRQTSRRWFALVTCSLLATAGCSNQSAAPDSTIEVRGPGLLNLTLPKLAEGFQHTDGGAGVTVNPVLGGTSTMTHQVNQGADHPDLMLLTSVEDIEALRRAHNALSTSNVDGDNAWSASPMVLVVRKGNPKHIRGWSDLARSGVKVLSLDPATAGAGRWALASVYGANLRQTHDNAKALAFTRSVIKNVVRWPTGFSNDSPVPAFAGGTADVMLADEGAAVSIKKANPDLEYIVPSSTLRVSYPWALLTNSTPKARTFLNYMQSTQGQQTLANAGWRPKTSGVRPTSEVQGAMNPKDPFPAVKDMFTISDIGGWSRLNAWLFDGQTALMQTQ